ncbi:MAG: hypothetical protein JWO43_626 [Candidatus Adlerbacteria bacterium]|nr:hypothetical protein [Candidatus Adlerbacteria bacterium]
MFCNNTRVFERFLTVCRDWESSNFVFRAIHSIAGSDGKNAIIHDRTKPGDTTSARVMRALSSAAHQYDALIVELTLPDVRSFNMICEIRKEFPRGLIVGLSQPGDFQQRVDALGAGADDVMDMYPGFGPELVLRLQKLHVRMRDLALMVA